MQYKIAERVAGISDSVTIALSAKGKAMAAAGEDVVNFGAGEPDFNTPEPVRAAAKRAMDDGQTRYTPAAGTPALRKAICEKFKTDNGLDYAPEQVVVSNGAKHSLYHALQTVCSPGDEVIIPAPYWVTYPEQVRAASGVPVIVPTSVEQNFKMTRQQLADAITDKTRVVMLNSPSNPTGAVYTRAELAELADVIVERDLLVITDEIYEKLVFGGAEHHSIAALGPEIFERSIVVNGVSKTYAMTGWRVGYTAGPAAILKPFARLQSHASSNPCSVSQAAALEAITGDQSVVATMRAAFDKRRQLLMERVAAIPGLSMPEPLGAFYAFVNVSEPISRGFAQDSVEFCNRCLEETKVVMIPGSPFGAEGYVRISYATSAENISEGLDRLKRVLALA